MGPNDLDWDLTLLDASSKLRYIIIENCNIGGTLPELANHSDLVYLLASNSKMSGTMSDIMFANTSSMSSLDLGSSCISGTLPHVWGSHRRVGNAFQPETLLLHNLDISGTLTNSTCPTRAAHSSLNSHLSLYSIDSSSLLIYCIACFIYSSSTINVLSYTEPLLSWPGRYSPDGN